MSDYNNASMSDYNHTVKFSGEDNIKVHMNGDSDDRNMSSTSGNNPRRNMRRHRCASLCETTESGHERAPLLGFASPRYGAAEEGDSTYQGSYATEDSGRHCHDGSQEVSRMDKKAMKKLFIASVLCFCFIILEVTGGVMANSLAIATDAAHMLTDLCSFIISLFSLFIASRAPTKKMSFGWYRAEVMGALVSVMMIWVVTGVLVYLAIQRCIHQDYEIDAKIMLITSGLAVAFNIVMGVTLHDTHAHSHGGHGHSHGGGGHGHGGGQGHGHNNEAQGHSHEGEGHRHSHNGPDSNSDAASTANTPDVISTAQETQVNVTIEHSHSEQSLAGSEPVAPKDNHNSQNINVRAAFIHVIGDLFQSIGVLIAAYIIYYKPEWKLADPICTFLFSILVIFTTINILKDAVHVLMEGAPPGVSYSDVKKTLHDILGVKEIHNLRIWSLTVNKCALAVHLAIDKKQNHIVVLSTANRLMREKFGIIECTVQIEEYCDTMASCEQCQEPAD